jgi:SPP1 gp7 family putative phage head morphogenesis protein
VRRRNILKTSRFAYNASVQEWYVKKLTQLVEKMVDETNRKVESFLKKPIMTEYVEEQGVFTQDANVASQARILLNKLRMKFDSFFSAYAKVYAEKMLVKEAKVSQDTTKRRLKDISGSAAILKGKLISSSMKEAATAALQENIDLIKSIPQQYMDQINGSVMRSLQVGGDQERIVQELKKYEGITHRRAENIAADQTRKAYNTINRLRWKERGIRKFEWIHSGGGQTPRPLHLKLDGQIFEIDDPPIIDEDTQEKGFPGQLPNCRCTMAAVIDFGEEDEKD